jgi:mono/diheme cytochrome c family protein
VLFRFAILLLAPLCVVEAHDLVTTKLTWSQEISRIIYKRCSGCHGEGGKPMSLMSYAEARPWAKAIRDEVLNRRMPPWGAVKGFGEFRDDASLTQEEISRIAQWVEGGAPEGDPIYLPPTPVSRSTAVPPDGIRLKQLPARKAELLGIRPLASAADTKIIAYLPDGTVEPLIWLHGYKREWNRTFVYREPVTLPAGTRLVAEPSVAVELLVAKPGTRVTSRQH